MELIDYIRIVRKSWVLILVSGLVALGLAAGVALVQRPTYQASALVFVSTASSDSVGELAQGNNFTLQRVNTYANLADTQRVLQPVVDGLGLEVDARTLADWVTATPQTDTTIIEISVQGSDPDAVAELANAVAQSLTVEVQAIETANSADATSPIRLEVVEPAEVPASPQSPRVPLYLAVGTALGVALALAVALLRELLDTRIRNAQDLAQATEHSLLGGIAFDPKAKERPLIVHADPLNPRAEAYRTLRTGLQFVEVDGSQRSFVVTSSVPGEGKSTTAANIALALASSGQTVVLVDSDLRKPKVATYMGLEGAVGLTDVLIGRVPLVDAVQEWGDNSNLYVLPAGQIPPNPSELLASKAMQKLVREFEREFDWVIFDAPPLLPVTDAAVLSKHLAGVVMVVAAGRTTRHQLESAVALLDNLDTHVSGLVLTMLPTRGADAYGAYGYGAYEYRERKPRRAGFRRTRTSVGG